MRKATSVLGALVLLAAIVVGRSALAEAATTIHVAPWGADGAVGSSGAPIRTLAEAVNRAPSGSQIVMRGGVYHESVQIYNKALNIRSADGERAVLDGTRVVEGFQPSGGDWYTSGWNVQFNAVGGPMLKDNGASRLPDQVFLDGAPLTQVTSRSAVVPGTFFHDTGADQIWLGDNPTGRRVEASDLSWGLYFNRANGSRLTNVTVRRYATQHTDMAAIRAYSNDLVFSGVTSELNAYMGLSAMGSTIVVRDSRFTDNGYIGLHGHQVNTLVVERSAILGNNKSGFDAKHSASGLKVTESSGITVRDSDVSRNDGPGIWTDINTAHITIARNLVENNGRSGIEIELGSNANVVGNVALNNGEAGIWILESQNIQVFHNASYGNEREIWVLEGPRRNVQNVYVRNNIVGQGRGDQQALLNVDDWTEERSAAHMNVTSDYNAFWLPPTSATKAIARWARWGDKLAVNGDIGAHRQMTGNDHNSEMSAAGSNPYVRNPGAGDYRAHNSLRLGAPVRGAMATELGVADGSRLRVGPVSVTPRR